MTYKIVLHYGYLLQKYNRLYSRFQTFNETGAIVSNQYHNHLIKSIVVVILQMLFMRFIKKMLKLKNDTGEIVLMLDLSSSMISFIKIIKKILMSS